MKNLIEFPNNSFAGNLVKKIINLTDKHEEESVSRHFFRFLRPLIADSENLSNESYKIRNDVYCNEHKFLNAGQNGLEIDEFDKYATHCLIQHIPTTRFSGTVRVVRPETNPQKIPLQKFFAESISEHSINPNDFAQHEICEISRLAVPKDFRRRQIDHYEGAATGMIDEKTYSENELRFFPFITSGLYLSAASIVLDSEIKHVFALMEPRLARSLRFIGIQFEQIGSVIEYHGMRAPYYINPLLMSENLTPGFQEMLNGIRKSLKHSSKNSRHFF